jgi:hypothetical protein
MKPIKGIRYKCAVREDFDLCESCEAKHVQPHSMLKIYHPDQSSVVTILSGLRGLSCPRKSNCHRSFGPRQFTQGSGCESRIDKWARCAKVLVDAMNERNESVPQSTETETKPAKSSVPDDDADIELRIIDDVIRMSVEEISTVDSHHMSNPATTFRSVDTKNSESVKPSEAGNDSQIPTPLRTNF